MKFRIKIYYDRYIPQVLKEAGDWCDIGLPNGHSTIQEAKDFCVEYKKNIESKIVEEFEL